MNDEFDDIYKEFGQVTDDSGKELKNDKDSPREAIIQRMADREAQYTQMTENFVKINYHRYQYKEFHKWTFFWVMTVILIFIAVIFGIVAIRVIATPIEQLIEHIPILLGAYASFISAIITIPLLIGKYLFSKTEEADLSKFVENMQAYDRKGQELFRTSFDDDYRNHY